MQGKLFLLILGGFLTVVTAAGQCPERDSLQKAIIFLTDSSKLSTEEQLQRLLNFESKIKDCSYKNDSTHILLLRRIGWKYFLLGNYAKAVQYCQRSINILIENEAKSSGNPKQLISGYYWLSRCFDSLHLFNDKMIALDSCMNIALRLKFVDGASLSAIYSRVEYSFNVGDYNRCISYATFCRILGRDYSKSGGEKEFKVGMAYQFSSLEMQVNALLLLNNFAAAEKLLANQVEEYKRIGFSKYFGPAYEQLAEVQINKGNIEKALFYFNKAITYECKAGNGINCSVILSNIGYLIYSTHLNNPDKALGYYKKAFAYIKKNKLRDISDSMEVLNILEEFADAYAQKGFFDSSFKYFQLAFDQIKPGINELEILDWPDEEFARRPKIYYLANLLIDKGDAFHKAYKSTKQMHFLLDAIRIYKMTDQLLNKIKMEQTDLQSKLFWRKETRRLYEHAIDACYEERNSTDVLYFFEKSRAVLLNDQIKEQRWLAEADIRKQTQIKKKIGQLERELSNLDNSSANYEELQNEVVSCNEDLDRLNDLIKNQNPLYSRIRFDSNDMTVQDVRKKILNDYQALMELFVGDSAAYSLSITARNIYFVKMNKLKFDSLTSSFISNISNVALQNSQLKGFLQTSHRLYELIFQNYVLPPGRIIISPDGQIFPFEALVTNTNTSTPAYFLSDHVVSYTYSASFLMNQFVTKSNTPPHNFLGVAPIQYPSRLNLPTLYGSDLSLKRIGSYINDANNLIAEKASKNNFLQQFSKYKIIQLYTHASDTSRNGEPVLYFSDSALYLSEILGENKPVTSLIVLSACETGSGTLFQGEGVFSMNRAFAALGIPSSISGIWTLDTESTYKLMELFYKYLAEGSPTDIALQRAKLEFMRTGPKKYTLPYYWASTILVGKNCTIEVRSGISWKISAMIISGTILVLLLIYKKVSGRKHKAAEGNLLITNTAISTRCI